MQIEKLYNPTEINLYCKFKENCAPKLLPIETISELATSLWYIGTIL